MSSSENTPASACLRQEKLHRGAFAVWMRTAAERALPRELRRRLRLRRRLEVIREFALDGLDFALGRRKELVPPRHLNFVGDGGFVETGDEFLRHFIALGGLTPGSRVLEIGCGIGRMARPLTKYLTTGTYDGIDIVPKGIRWCQRNISTRFPNFKFHLANIHNLAYNPQGALHVLDYRLPFADGTFDFVVLTSVFTHMLSSEMEHYFREATRCLRQNGTALITFFLLNQESRALIEQEATPLGFRFARPGCWVNDDLVPEYAVAYDEERIRQLCAELGLGIESTNYGMWCGRTVSSGFQDMLIFQKAA